MAFLSTLGSRKKSLLTVVTATAAACLLALAPLSANAEGEPDPNTEVVTTEGASAPEEETAPIEETEEVTDETPATEESIADSEKEIVTEESSRKMPKKVFVCKYVGTPGVDEALQTGQNPISVSVNSIQNWDGIIPGYFSDAHDRSYVLEYDEGQEEPDVSECPDPDDPFNWDWEYAAPTCTALTVVYPSDIPSGQANDVNVRIENLLTNQELTLNFHKDSGTWSGTKVFDFTTHPNWPNWSYYKVEWVQVAGTNYHWEGTVTCGTPPPPVVQQCTAPNAPITLTNLDDMFFEDRQNPSDPTNKGTHELVDGGIEISTTGGGYYSKSAGYIAVDIPFEEIGSPSLGYTVYSGASAGLNLTLYKNGVWFGNLVYEPLFAEWWINKAVPGMSAGPNPGYQLAYGTLDEFLQAFVANGWDVDVKAIGYSLGSNAVGAGLVTSLVIGCDTYLFDKAFVAPTASAQIICTEGDPSLEVTGTAGSEETEFQTQIFGVTVHTETVAPYGSYSYPDPISEFQNGDSFTVTVLANGVAVFGPTEFTIDCEEPEEPTIVVPESPTMVDPCGTDDDSFTLPSAEPGETESVTDEGTYTADDQRDENGVGDVIVTFTPAEGFVVSDTKNADYELDENGNAVWTFTFTDEKCPTNPPVTPPSTTGLPNTGSGNPLPFVGVGFLLLFAGLSFVLIQQRRRNKANASAE
ncbi:MAG: LPXTG cell wall anchor domain-containing protein [Candidatus Microsaccharimonas sp.]